MVKPEKFGHLHLVYHFTIHLKLTIPTCYSTKAFTECLDSFANLQEKPPFLPDSFLSTNPHP